MLLVEGRKRDSAWYFGLNVFSPDLYVEILTLSVIVLGGD